MDINLDIAVDDSKKLTQQITEIFRIAVEKCGMEWLNATKQILNNKGAFDTGEFINSIHYTVRKRKDTFTMIGMDAVKYGIYIEKGTVKHWVPFYKYVGKDSDGKSMYDTSQPILADWGHRVLGLSEKEMLKRGGMNVSNAATNAFEVGLMHLNITYKRIFEETFRENMK